jgi:hypothetical protein
MTCDEVRMSLGVYVLGALDDEEIPEVEAHLDECPLCRAELAELSGLPAVLDLVSEQDIEHVARPPHAVLDRVIAASARRKRRSRVMLALAASVVVAALGGTAWLGVVQNGQNVRGGGTASQPSTVDATGGKAGPAADQPMQGASPGASAREEQGALEAREGDVWLGVQLAAQKSGTRVEAKISGVRAGTWCSLLAIGRDGRVSRVTSWSVPEHSPERKLSYHASTELGIHEIQRFEMTTSDGHTLVTQPVSRQTSTPRE